MKHAVIIALAVDRRSGLLLSGVLPADQAISQVKQLISKGVAPDARFPNVGAVAMTDFLRQHRFQVTQAEIDQASQPVQIAGGQVTLGDLIPVQIGEGEEMVIVNVSTQEEADFLKEMAESTLAGCAEIQRLQKSMSDALEANKASIAASEKELSDCRAAFVKHEAFFAEANAEIERLKAAKAEAEDHQGELMTGISERDGTIAARDGQIEGLGQEVREQCLRIQALESQLVEATAKAKKK